MAALAADPPAAQVPAAGGKSTHQLVNSGGARLAFKVKSSNNNEYRLKPVFGFVEAGASSPLEITRLPGAPKDDKMVVQFAEVPAEADDPQAPFKAENPLDSPETPPKSNETVDSPINLPEIILEDRRIVYDIEPLITFVKDVLNGPRLPLRISDGIRYPPLQRFHMAFHHLFDGERPTTINEVRLLNFKLIVHELENVIQRSVKFLMSCEEFSELPMNDKWEMFRRFSSNVMTVVRAVATVDFFGFDIEDTRIMYTDTSCIYADGFDYAEEVPEAVAETLRKMFRPFVKNVFQKIVVPFKQLQITKFEAVYILAGIVWNVDDIEGISVETQEAADRFMSEAASELHHYYRFEMKMENYAERLTKLVKIINSVEKMAAQRKEIFALVNIFDMFSLTLSMTPKPSNSEDNEECMVCGGAPHGIHFGVFSCRACAAFFRRTIVTRKSYRCRVSTNNCNVKNAKRYPCKACRFEKCKRLGMRLYSEDQCVYPSEKSPLPQPNSVNSEQSSNSDRSSAFSPVATVPSCLPQIYENNPELVYDTNPFLQTVSQVLNGPQLPLDPPLNGEIRYTPLQRLQLAFKQFYVPKGVTCQDLLGVPAFIKDMERTLLCACNFWMCVEEFTQLPIAEKWQFLRKSALKLFLAVRMYQSIEVFGFDENDPRYICGLDVYTTIADFKFDTSKMNGNAKESLNRLVRPNQEKFFDLVLTPARKIRITNVEIVYIIAVLFWNTEDIDDLDPTTKEKADRFLEELGDELHGHYKYVMRIDNYANRLMKVARMIESITKLALMRKEFLVLAEGLMTARSKSGSEDSEDECLICGAPPHGIHFGVNSCRACAAFFRRTLASGRVYQCLKGSKNCRISKDIERVCRCCRFQKCRRLGMKYNEADRPEVASMSPTTSASLSDYRVSSHIRIENHKIVYDINQFLELIGSILSGPQTPFEPPICSSVRYPPLQRLQLALPVLFNEAAYKSRTFREVMLINIIEAIQEMEKSIYHTAKFAMTCKEFVDLDLSDKWLLFQQCAHSCFVVVRNFLGMQIFGCDVDDRRMIFGEDFYCFVDRFNFDTTELGLTEENAKKTSKMLGPFAEEMCRSVAQPMKVLRITKPEMVYLLALTIWNADNQPGLSPDALEVAERFKEKAANELHNYYKFELRMDNYAYRITKLTNIVHALEKVAVMRKEIFTMAKVFDLFSCALFEKDSFI